MTREAAIAALHGQAVTAYGLTWTTPQALRQLTWGSGIEFEAEALQAVASAFQLDLVFVDAALDWADAAVRLLRAADVASAFAVAGVLSRVASVMGWAETLRASAGEPGALAYALDEALHDVLVDVRTARSLGADVLVIADELSSTAGWLVSPDFALDALVPCYRRVLEEWAERPCVFHSDGDVRALYGPLRSVGFDGVHVAVPDVERLAACVSAARSAGLCPVGGLRTAGLREDGARRSAEQVVAMGLDGPFVVSDDGGMTSAEEIAAFAAAIDVVREWEEL